MSTGLLAKIGLGTFFVGASLGVIGCDTHAYFGANDPALAATKATIYSEDRQENYNTSLQKAKAERTVEALEGGLPILTIECD